MGTAGGRSPDQRGWTKSWVRSRGSSYGICSWQSGSGEGFTRTSAFLVNFIPPALHTNSFITDDIENHQLTALLKNDTLKTTWLNCASSRAVSLRHILMLTSHLRLCLPNTLFPWGFPTIIVIHLHFYCPERLCTLRPSYFWHKNEHHRDWEGILWLFIRILTVHWCTGILCNIPTGLLLCGATECAILMPCITNAPISCDVYSSYLCFQCVLRIF